jgi:hypothetical protein
MYDIQNIHGNAHTDGHLVLVSFFPSAYAVDDQTVAAPHAGKKALRPLVNKDHILRACEWEKKGEKKKKRAEFTLPAETADVVILRGQKEGQGKERERGGGGGREGERVFYVCV